VTWSTVTPITAGAPVSKATFFDPVSTDLAILGNAWTAWTTTWSVVSGTAPAKGNGTFTGRYMQAGKLVIFSLDVTMGSTTTFGSGTWQFSLPVAARIAGSSFGFFGTAHDASSGNDYPIAFQQNAASTIAGRVWSGTAAFQAVNATNPFTWASGDAFSVSGVYEAA
jgi:hypothetical protein